MVVLPPHLIVELPLIQGRGRTKPVVSLGKPTWVGGGLLSTCCKAGAHPARVYAWEFPRLPDPLPSLSPALTLVESPYLLLPLQGFCLGPGWFPMTFVRHSWLTFGNSEGSPRGRQSSPGSCYYCGQGRQLWGPGTLPLFTLSGSTGQLPICPSPDPTRPSAASALASTSASSWPLWWAVVSGLP